MKLDLRPYQVDAFAQARELIRQGKKRILIVAPTGSGKTVLSTAMMEMVVSKGNRANFVVDRLSLINQTSEMLDRYGLIEHGVIQASHPRFRPSLPIQVCSVQTLARRHWPESAVDIFDEAHVLHTTHKARMGRSDGIVIGLTATPFTRGLGKWFDAVINVTTTRALIEQGWLSPYRVFSCAAPDMSGVTVKSTGEWDETEASGKALEVVGDVVAEYLKLGEGRKFIASAVDTAHVQELVRQFQAAGINVASYTYRDAEEYRADITTEFRKPDSAIRGLVTVTAASRGFDIPDVSCIIMARPLRKSLAEHVQLLGRGLRIAPDKQDCLVLDHASNMPRFWVDCEHFFDHGLAELDDGKPKKEPKKEHKADKEPVKCPQCRHLHKPGPHCPACGFEYPRKSAVQHVAGTLKELLANPSAHPQRLAHELFPQIAAYAMARREGDAARRMAQAIYHSITGEFARVAWEHVRPATITPEVLRRIRSSQIRYAKGQGSHRSSRPMRVPPEWGETREIRAQIRAGQE